MPRANQPVDCDGTGGDIDGMVFVGFHVSAHKSHYDEDQAKKDDQQQ
jgi:hypothetical protein